MIRITKILSSEVPVTSFGPAKNLFDLMQMDFKMDLSGRLVIVPEVAMYRIKEDESIFEQAKTSKYEYQVYFDGEYVSGFNVMDHPQRARINCLKGLKRLYTEGKIHWDKKEYELEELAKKDKEKAEKIKREAKRKKPRTKEEKMVDLAVRKALKVT